MSSGRAGESADGDLVASAAFVTGHAWMHGMGELVNLRRVRKVAKRAAKQKIAAANRIVHGTPKDLKKLRRREEQRADRIIEAHRLDPDRQR
jgi:hypothetical protein